MERFVKIWVLFLMVSVYACSSKEIKSDCLSDSVELSCFAGKELPSDLKSTMKFTPPDIAELEDEEPASAEAKDVQFENSEFVQIQRKLIKKGQIEFETTDAQKTREKIANIVSLYKGYISEDNIEDYGYDNTEDYYHTIIIRVPADKFDSLLNIISESAEKLTRKNIEILDVTEEFIDVEARIKTKKELEERYKELLKKANKVEEMLSIEKEMGILRAEIESTEGRRKYLQDRVSYSTLRVNFYEKTEKNTPFGFGSKFTTALKDGWESILSFAIGLTKLWAFLLLGIIIFLKVRYLIKRKKKRQSTQVAK